MRCSSCARARARRSEASVSARSMAAAAAVPRCRARSRSSSLAACASGHTTPSTAVEAGRAARPARRAPSAGRRRAAARRSAPDTRRSDEASAQSTMPALARGQLQQRAGLAGLVDQRRHGRRRARRAQAHAVGLRHDDGGGGAQAAAGGGGHGRVGLGGLAGARERVGDLEVAGAQHLAPVELPLQRGAVDGERGDLREGAEVLGVAVGERALGAVQRRDGTALAAAGQRHGDAAGQLAGRRPRGTARRRRPRCAPWRSPGRRRRRTRRGRPVPTASSATGSVGARACR